MDVVLHYFDEYVLDALYAVVLPASPSSPLLRRSPALLSAFLADGQTHATLAHAAHTRIAGAAGAKGFLHNLTSTLARAAWPASHSIPAVDVARIADTPLPDTAYAALDWPAVSHLSALPRSSILRQSLSLYAITYVGILLLYFLFAGLSYRFLFNKAMLRHPRFLKNQVRLEIAASLRAFPVLDALTLPWFVAEVRGHSRLYSHINQGPWADRWFGLHGWTYAALISTPFFLLFTDACIYWVHRLEHHPRLYKHVHKPHHKWLVPSPFASHAFHPLDGYAQSLPYHIFVFLFPLHRTLYIGLFVFVNLWSILIHDSDMICNSPLEKFINGPSHHTLHHLYFSVNYGQYFTGCDRLGGSYRAPKLEDDPLHDVPDAGSDPKAKVEKTE
ncbi:hypothetical protein K437DRAFT_254183 [Tilletiaria anomala UBC 951]|uniref:Fatty acid hydroxylase domain-containing protein n=1 Tax=Tilletiaria anomala (strain ATCC 24038 / CBS 436.72 / UBC 951) TaxID=1037660 RepID=A0A066WIP5_TILAU|nr:uncharacterized protein K437DRAFT_254183 [Tilletiaria anomala UBC 951]KDN52408.1 hypothetical protein K437DRAFT_254183 [Tilletiaria anomala UBC 951]